MNQGLKNYSDVKTALKTFEDEIFKLLKSIIKNQLNWGDFKPDLSNINVYSGYNSQRNHIGVAVFAKTEGNKKGTRDTADYVELRVSFMKQEPAYGIKIKTGNSLKRNYQKFDTIVTLETDFKKMLDDNFQNKKGN